ncbi:hypothetical protein ACP275_03G008400 [Erythranthe tilingii]
MITSYDTQWLVNENAIIPPSAGLHAVLGFWFLYVYNFVSLSVWVISFAESSTRLDRTIHFLHLFAPFCLPLSAIFLGDYFNDKGSAQAFAFLSLSVVFLLMSVNVYTDFGLVDMLVAVTLAALLNAEYRWPLATLAAVLGAYKVLVFQTRSKAKEVKENEARAAVEKEREQQQKKHRDQLEQQYIEKKRKLKERYVNRTKQLEQQYIDRELQREIERETERERERERQRERVHQRKARERVKEREGREQESIKTEIEIERERERQRERVKQRKARERKKET